MTRGFRLLRTAILGLVAALAFAAVVPGGDWVFDDHVLIERNAELRKPAVWWSAFARDYYATSEAPGVSGYYRPIAVLCNAFDVHVWRSRPQGAHVTNIVLHVLATLALPAALGALGVPVAAASATALVFAVHPVHAASVAFVSGRVDVLATWFILLALAAAASRHRLAWLWLGLSSLLAFLSKEIAMVLPVLLALLWWGRWAPARAGQGVRTDAEQRSGRDATRGSQRLGPARVAMQVAAVAGAVVIALVLRAHALPSLLPASAQAGRAAGSTFLPVETFFFALASLFAPVVRIVVEPDPARLGVWRCLVGAVVAGGAWASALALAPGARATLRRLALAGLVSLLPVLNLLPQETRLSERFLYLQSAFLLAPLGMLAQIGWEKRGRIRAITLVILATAVVVLGGISSWRARLWRDDIRVWQQAVSEEPERAAFWDRLGLALTERRAHAPAEEALRRAVALDPHNFNAWHNLGVLLQAKRDYREAMEAFRRAIELHPQSVSSHVNLGRILLAARDLDGAYAEFEAALAIKPDHFEALRMAGMVAIQIEDFDGAERYLGAARRLQPENRTILQALQKLEQHRQGP